MTALHKTKSAGKLVFSSYGVSTVTLTSENLGEKQVHASIIKTKMYLTNSHTCCKARQQLSHCYS